MEHFQYWGKSISVEIKISDEDKCISLFFSLPDLWDTLVMVIGSNATSLNFDEVVSSLLLKDMRLKHMEGHIICKRKLT